MNRLLTTLAVGALASAMTAYAAEPIPYFNPCDDVNTVKTTPNVYNTTTKNWERYSHTTTNGVSDYGLRVAPANTGISVTPTAWLFTPELALEDGKIYKISVDNWLQTYRTTGAWTVVGYLCDGQSADANKTQIYKRTDLRALTTMRNNGTLTNSTYVKSDGTKRYVGIENQCKGNYGYFYVDNIKVEEVSPLKAAAPSNLALTNPSTQENPISKKVSGSFIVPSENIVGDPLTSISSVKVLRNGNVVIKEWSNPEVGATLTFDDEVSTVGTVSYTVETSTDGVAGESATQSINVGAFSLTPSINSDTYRRNSDWGPNYYVYTTYLPGQGVKLHWLPYTTGPKDSDGNPYPVSYTIRTPFDYDNPLAENITASEWLDTNVRPGLNQLYTYLVEVYYDNGGETLQRAATYTSQTLSTNNPAPFFPGFSAEALCEFGNYNYNYGNGNTATWSFASSVNQSYHPGVTKAFNCYANNNWLVSPGVLLQKGKTYRIDLEVFDNTISHSIDIEFQLCVSNSNSPESMENVLIERTPVTSLLPKLHYAFFTPQEDMNAFFGVWATNPTDANTYTYLAVSKFDIYEVSPDLPAAVENLKVAYNKDDSSKATLSFNAPTKNIAGGDVTALTKIELYKNEILAQTLDNPTPGELCNFEIGVELGKADNYMIVGYTAAGKGLETTLSVQLFEAPYSNNFNNNNSITGWEIINPDKVGASWGIQAEAARCYSGGDGYDDYFVSTPIHLEGNYWYKADMAVWLESTGYTGATIELLVGTSPDVESMTKVAIPTYDVTATRANKQVIKDYFRIDESGEYYLALHAYTPAGSRDNICVDDLHLSAKIDPTVPAPVSNFTITPDPNGALSPTKIHYELPTVDLDGNPLTYTISKVEFYFDEFPTSSMNTYYPKAGETEKDFEFTHWKVTDNGPKDYKFWVIAYKDNNNAGRENEQMAFIGINRPAPIKEIEVTEYDDEYGKVHFKWDAPTYDYMGYKLNTSDIKYNVCRYETYYDYSLVGTPILKERITTYAEDITDTECDAVVKANADKQEFCHFYVLPKTTAGVAPEFYLSRWIAVGKPYEMPIYESFPDMKFEYFTMSQTTHGYSQWGFNSQNPVTGVQPVDGDNGMMIMEVAWADAGSRIYTARINVTGEQPIFTMYVYNQTSKRLEDTNELTVEVRDGNNADFLPVESHSINEWANGKPGWQKVQVDLSDYFGKTIYLSLDGFAHSHTFTHVDGISLADKGDVDLNLHTISHPEVYVGAPHAVTVNVKNLGKAASGEYTAKLLLDGEEVASKTCESLDADGEGQIVFDHLLSRNYIGFHTYSITVECEGDVDLIDNTIVAAEFELRDNTYPQVENLVAEETEGALKLSWEAPTFSTDIVEVTEDFDNMVEWTTIHTGGLGDWTLLDLDGGAVGGFQNFEMPNVEFGSTQSFYLMDTSDPFFATDTRYRAHSGDLCLVSSYNIDQTYTEDAIISPLLSGEAQTVKFWAKALTDQNKEYFHFLYSTTDTNLDSFVEMEGRTVGAQWTEFTYELPEGALYFMIVHENIYGGYFFFLDDITFTPLGYGNLVLNGYHVYREGDKMTADGHISDLAWNEDTPEVGTKRYGVSALYNLGESYPVEIHAEYAGMENLTVANPTIKVQDMAIVIANARGKNVTISNTAGMVLTSFTAAATNRVPMPAAGIYLVTIDNTTTKVVVK